MLHFTLIANTEDSTLVVSNVDKNNYRLFAELFTGNPDARTIPEVLAVTEELKERLHLFDKYGDQAYKLNLFFNQIPDGHHFFVIPGRMDDHLQHHRIIKELSKLDGTEYNEQALDCIDSALSEHYHVKLMQGDERIRVGIKDKRKRVCRFCGNSMPDVRFDEKAHAISESLGNKGLICLEECVNCNHRFNETIEQDIANLFRSNLMLHAVHGKKGIPSLKDRRITVTNDTSTRATLGRDTIVLHVNDMPNTKDDKEIRDYLSKGISLPETTFIPQNIYKCFCKYVLSLIDAEHLPYFKETIKWINEPLKERRLPPIWEYEVPMDAKPSILIMLRKHNRKEYPCCWAIISIAAMQYLFIVPFCSLDKYKFVHCNTQMPLLECVHKIMPHVTLTPRQMSRFLPVKLVTNFKIKIPSDIVDVRDNIQPAV